MKKRRSDLFLFIILVMILTALTLSACTKRKGPDAGATGAPDSSAAEGESGTQNGTRKVLPLTPSETAGEVHPQNAPQAPQRDLGPLSEFLSLDPESRFIASDRRIGRLIDRYSTNTEIRAIYRLTSEFFDGLAKKKILDNLILPSERLELQRTLSYTLRDDTLPKKYRIGDFTYTDETGGYLKILVIGEPGMSEGEVYFEKTDAGWLIADVQVDLLALAQAAHEDDTGFQPEDYDSPF